MSSAFLQAAKSAAKSKAWESFQTAKDGFDDSVNVPDGEYICSWGGMTCRGKDGKASVEFVTFVKDGEHKGEKLRCFFYDIFGDAGAAERLGKTIKRLGFDSAKLKPEQLIQIEKELNAPAGDGGHPDVKVQVKWKTFKSNKTGKEEERANIYINGIVASGTPLSTKKAKSK